MEIKDRFICTQCLGAFFRWFVASKARALGVAENAPRPCLKKRGGAVTQTFVGPFDVFDLSSRLGAVSDLSQVLRCSTLAPSREPSNGNSSVSLNKFLPHSLVTYPLSFLLSNSRNYLMSTYQISFCYGSLMTDQYGFLLSDSRNYFMGTYRISF